MIKATIPWNVKQIVKMFDNKCLCFDNAIQRGEVWDKKRKSLLIDSMLRNYPVPPMYTIKTNETVVTPKGNVAVFDCIDGKQRCNAISSFVHNQFALEGLADESLNGKKYEDLDDEQKDDLNSYSITVYYFTDITDEEVCEMMSRLNNGKPLTGIENARIKSKCLNVIAGLANHRLFTEHMTETALRGYHNEDVVLKTKLQLVDNMFELSTKNVRGAYESEIKETEMLKEIFDKTAEVLDIVADGSKKMLKKMIKKTNLVAVIYFVGKHMDVSADEIAAHLILFFDNSDDLAEYDSYCTNGTNHSLNVTARNDILNKSFAD